MRLPRYSALHWFIPPFSKLVHPRRPAIAPVVLWQSGLSRVGHSFVCASVIQLHKKGEHLGR